MNTKFLFIDVFTQKIYVENFGSRAIENCPDIRENLMDLTHMALREQIPILSLMHKGEGPDFEKVSDTDTEAFDPELRVYEEIPDLIFDKYKDRVVFIYGVPLNEKVYKVCIEALSHFAKVWLVQDAVKSTEANEENLINELKEKGVKMITTRNLDKFVGI